MGYESNGSRFESSPEQVDASLSTDAIDAGNTEIAESDDQYDFDETDVGEYAPEEELLTESQEDSVEISEMPEMADTFSTETGELDENDFDEADVGEYDAKALEEDAEIPDSSIEPSYEGSEAFPESAENDFDEADVGEYEPESVEGGSDENTEPDSGYNAEFIEGGVEENSETNLINEGTEIDELDEDNESDEGNPEDVDEDSESDEENLEGEEEDAEADVEYSEDMDEDAEAEEGNPESEVEDTESGEENFEGEIKDAEANEETAEDVDEDAESDEENPEGEIEDAEANEETSEDAGEDAEAGKENPEGEAEDTESDEENPEDEVEDTESDEENPEGADEDADANEENPEGEDEDVEADEEDPEGEDEDAEANVENPEGEAEDTESDEENPESEVEDTESDEENSDGEVEDTKPDEENLEGADEDTESDKGNPEGADEDAEANAENPESEVENADADEENPEGEDENAKADAENPEGEAEDTESDEENPEGEDEDVEADEEDPEGEDEDAEADTENPEGEAEDTESDEENPEGEDKDVEADEEDLEGKDEDAEADAENPEGEAEDTESDEENPEDEVEDTESDEENPEGEAEDTEPDEENPEEEVEDTELNEENPEGEAEDTESDGENPGGEDEDAEAGEKNSEGEDEDAEADAENPESAEEDAESDEENPEGADKGAEAGEENPEDENEDLKSSEEYHKDQQLTKKIRPEGDRGREDIAYDADSGQREWQSFIGASEKERPSGVMAMGAGVVASEVVAMHREELRQARNAETPELNRGETIPTLRKGHEQTIIAATENKLEDKQPPEMFPDARVEAGTENHPERDYVDEPPKESSVDQELEKKDVADAGQDVDPNQDAAGQIAQAAQAATAGLVSGALGGSLVGTSEPGGPPNGPDEPQSGSSGPGESGGPPRDRHSFEERGSRVRVEIPLITGHEFGSSPLGAALQFGQPLTQLQRLVSQVPIPTNEMQGDAALADMIARMGILPMRLGFPKNVVTMEDVRVFRNSRGLRWLRLGDKKSLVLVDASNKTYVQELKEIAEPDDTKPEIENQIEAPDIPAEEFERRLEIFDEDEIAAYEQQKMLDVYEAGLRFRNRETLLGDYTCHGIEHIQEVMSESERYISALEEAGIEVPESLKQSCGVAAKYHDIGMADNAGMAVAKDISEKVKQPDSDFSKLMEYYNLDPNATIESTKTRIKELTDAAGNDTKKVEEAQKTGRMQMRILSTKLLANQLREMSPDDPKRHEAEMAYRISISIMQDRVYENLRNSHAHKSAEYVLGHSDEIKERYGRNMNPRNVACAIMLHTKKNSGCGDLASLTSEMAGEGSLSVEESCSHLVADWNLNHSDQRVETTFSEEDLKEIAFIASVLRPADNRRDGTTATFTNGDRVLCETSGDKVALYHGKEKDGVLEKTRRVMNDTSVNIISAESCTQFGEIRPEGSDMVHVMRFNGRGSAPLERLFAQKRIEDYVSEVESSVFKSMVSENGTNGGQFERMNIIEVHVLGASNTDCSRLEQKWRQLLANSKKEAVKQYGAAGRLRVMPVGKGENV